MNKDELKQLILEKIDASKDPWIKIAFYSDLEVMALVEELYKRWEEGNRLGDPIDYATDEELEFLAQKAKTVKPIKSEDIVQDMMFRAVYGFSQVREPMVKRDILSENLKRLFLPR
jgi:hypothetical protein